MIKRLIDHFTRSKWVKVWEQIDRYKLKKYEIFKKTNNNWLTKYKKIVRLSSSCYTDDIRLINN